MKRYIEQLKEFYLGLELRARRMLLGSLAFALVALAGVSVWASQVPYAPLVAGGDVDQIRQAAGALESEGILYEISDNGTRLDVPKSSLGRAWIVAASVDVLPGLSDVSEMPAVLTPGQQTWAFTRAREGDIARMINEIQGVAATRVTLVPREEGTYFGETRPATASIMVRLKRGSSLSGRQVLGVVNLVSSAVDGLEPSGVSLVDDKGNLLSENSDGGPVGDGSDLGRYRNKLEGDYVSSVRSSLLPLLGYGSDFSVTATVELKLTSTETVTNTIETTQQAVLSEQVEETVTQDASTGGVPGVDANQAERTARSGRSQNSERTASTFNYAYPTVEEVSRTTAGGVERVSVAVQVNETRLMALAQANEGLDLDQVKADIQATVRAAVGYNEARGDQVLVTFLPFMEPEMVEATAGFAVGPDAMRYAIAALGMILFFLYVVRPVMSQVTPTAKSAVEVKSPAKVESIKESPTDDESGSDLVGRLRRLVDNYEPVGAGDLNRLVDREEEAAAQVIRLWTRHG